MSKEKRKKFKHGGARPGSGPKPNPDGPIKTKICVSVTEKKWQAAVTKWKKKKSWLVDRLVAAYVKRGQAVLEMGAA